MTETKKIKIIIAEDCKLTAMGLSTMIKEHPDFEVVGIAQNGEIAVSMAQKLKPDIILMDIGMPIIDGIQATKKIKNSNINTKIIMLTSHDSKQDVFDALSSGANSYCMKDIETNELVNVIKTTYIGASWLDPHIAQFVINMLNDKQEEQKLDLTEREQEILMLISKGLTNIQISEILCISMNTVKTHVKNIFQKLEVTDRTQAAMKAFKEDII